ncbi:MAG: CPBP family intramembrane metalloprotease [Phycisphaerae bacterium]|jgi:hypothetical protein
MSGTWRRCCGLAVLGLLWAGGCSRPAPSEENVVRDVAKRGPLQVTVEARPRQVWLGDPIEITVQAIAPEDYVVRLPESADFGNLNVHVTDAPDSRPAPEGGREWRRTFVLESTTSGTLTLPPLGVKYGRLPAEPGTNSELERELTAEPLKVEVRSALTSQDSPAEPRDITGTELPPKTAWQSAHRPLLIGVVVALVLGGLALAWVFYRRRGLLVPPVAPEVWALRMLAVLEAEDLLSVERDQEFYFRLSETVRQYVERKFDLAAPDMTTEEFLQTLARDGSALPYDADRLRAFLESCDIVKYAALRPQPEDGAEALRSARAFVQETAAAAERMAQAHDLQQTMGGDEAEGRAA